MATGDLRRSLRKLQQVLRSINYPNEVDYIGLMKGETAAFLPIISYSFTSYSPYVSELLMESNVELLAKNDVRFTDTIYKLLRDQFDYKPVLTKKQFIQSGFAEWKIQIVCDILNCVMKKHKELIAVEKNLSCQRKKNISEEPEACSNKEKTPAEAVGFDITGRFMTSGKKKAVVIRHLYTEDSVNIPEGTVISTEVSDGCDESEEKTCEVMTPEERISEVRAELQAICNNPEITELQITLAECQEKLKKLTWLEKRVECLEAAVKGKVMVDEKAWNNLLSRVTLLETEMLLAKKNIHSEENNAACEDYDSVSGMDIIPYDKKTVLGNQQVRLGCLAVLQFHQSQHPGAPLLITVASRIFQRIAYFEKLPKFVAFKLKETTIRKMERMEKMFEKTVELLKCSSH